MKAPAFWWRPRPGVAARMLQPVGSLYGAVTAARMARAGARLDCPVICVGNLVAGGAGKTPAALALAALLQEDGHRPAFLSRGYGRVAPLSDVLVVDPARDDARTAGDEPLLLARAAPTVVGVDRRVAARTALANGADCLILDDGLQNPALAKSWTLAVSDGATGIGNGLCVPAGPLRAPATRQWPAVSMLCVIGPGLPGQGLAARASAAGVPVTAATLVPDGAVLAGWRSRPVFAFAGIGRPAKFFATLDEAGLTLAGTRSFPDHHRFSEVELAGLKQAAGSARLVTTAKDRTRLPPDFVAEVLPVTLAFDDSDAIRAALRALF